MHYHYHLFNHYSLCPFFNGPDGPNEIRQLISFLNPNQINLKLWVTVCRVQLSISYSSLFDPINLSQVNQSEKKHFTRPLLIFTARFDQQNDQFGSEKCFAQNKFALKGELKWGPCTCSNVNVQYVHRI